MQDEEERHHLPALLCPDLGAVFRFADAITQYPLAGVTVGKVIGVNVNLPLAVFPIPATNKSLGIAITFEPLGSDQFNIVTGEHNRELPGGVAVNLLYLFRADKVVNRLGVGTALPFLLNTESYFSKAGESSYVGNFIYRHCNLHSIRLRTPSQPGSGCSLPPRRLMGDDTRSYGHTDRTCKPSG
ncbi:hypothetical protein ES703_119851 [subsurface metagenome]